MSDELTPCPHCEGIGSVAYGGWSESGAWACVQCQTCKICTESCLDISEAIAAWNNRPIEDKLQARIDALEWLREVEAYDPHAEHPLCTAAGNSSERGKAFKRAKAEHEAILAAAREAVES